MTRSELIEEIAVRADLSREKSSLVVGCIFDTMADALKRGERIEIRNFGNFVVRKYDPYVGRNPKTGRKVLVPEKKMPFFKSGLELKKMINEG